MKRYTHGLGMLGLCLIAGAALADDPQDGALDPSWNGDGKATIAFDEGGEGNNEDAGESMAAAPDGSLFVVGVVVDADVSGRIGVAKRTPAGAADAAFNGDGKNLAPITGIEYAPVKAVWVKQGADNRLLVAATRRTSPTNTDIVVCRFDADSGESQNFEAPDNPVNGCMTTPLISGNQAAADILAQPDGKFIVVGTHVPLGGLSSEKYVYAARFNTDGSIDGTFDSTPIRDVALFDSHEPKAAALASNGKIVIVGESRRTGSSVVSGLVMRLNADGTLDTDGEMAISLSESTNTAFADLVLEKAVGGGEDVIVAAGSVDLNPDAFTSGLIAKIVGFIEGEELDTSFGDEGLGYVTAPGGLGNPIRFKSVAAHSCAGYVVAGDFSFEGPLLRDIFVTGYKRNGAVNGSFGSNGPGVTIIDFSVTDVGSDVTVQGNDIYVAGLTVDAQNNVDFAAAKLFMDSLFCNGFAGYGLE